MKLAEEIIFLIKLREKCMKYCQASYIETSFSTEINLLVENKLISDEAVKVVREIYFASSTTAPKRVVADPCGSSYSGTRNGGC